MEATVPAAGVAGEQHAVLPHDAEHPLVVDHRLTRPAQFSVGQRRDAAITVGWALTDQELMPYGLDVPEHTDCIKYSRFSNRLWSGCPGRLCR